MIGEDASGKRVETPTVKRVRPVDEPTPREMRERRDMIYIILKQNLGLSPNEIAAACKYAAKSPRQIRRRIDQASTGLVKRRLAACG